MVISRITAITSGSRIKPVGRVREIGRGTDIPSEADPDLFDDIVFARREGRSSRPGKDLIAGDRPPVARSSAGVQEQLNRLKLGG